MLALPERPALGVTLAFLARAVGQVLGAMGFGPLMAGRCSNVAVPGLAVVALGDAGMRRGTA